MPPKKTKSTKDIVERKQKARAEGKPDTQYFINQEKFATREEFEKAKRTPGFRESTLRNPANIATIPEEKRTPEQTRILQSENIAVQAQKAQEREAILGELGGTELKGQLEQDILNPPDLAPRPAGEVAGEKLGGIGQNVAETGLQVAATGGNIITGLAEMVTGKQYGRTTAEELASTKIGKALGLATVGTAAALAGAAAAPYVAAAAARATIIKSVAGAGGSILSLKGAAAGLSIYLVGKSVFDYRGDRMDTFRKAVKGVTQDGEKIEAAMKNGFPTTDTISLLGQINEEINYAESQIKQLGELNLQYRVSQEYVDDMNNVRSARISILRRLEAVNNVAATGQAILEPEALMYQASQFK